MSVSRFAVSILLSVGLATSPALAQRLGKPTHSQEDPDQRDRIERERAQSAEVVLGDAVTEVVVKAGEKVSVLLAAGADGVTEVKPLISGTARNSVTISLIVKNGTSTLRIDNRSGGVIGFSIGADPTGAGSWAKAGEVSGIKTQQVSNTDYRLELHAVRITDLTFATKK